MQGVSREWWNTDRWPVRFTMCQMNPRDPFGIGFAGDNYCWIFLTSESLEKYLHRRPSRIATATVAGEKAALAELTKMLKENENLRRAEARDHCASRFKIGPRGFVRIWPRAREAAGLSPIAPAGRKPRQSSR
jgi:hypothetical protein